MKTVLAALGGIIAFTLLLVGLSFAFGWSDVLYTKTVGKAQENARRQVFEQTQSYVEGKAQELTKYRLEYQTEKDPVAKEAIRQTIIQSFSNVDASKMPFELQSFLSQVRGY